MAEIGRRVAALCKRAGMTYEDLADELKISRDAVKKIVSGENLSNVAKVLDLVRALKATPDELFGFRAALDPAFVFGVLEASYLALDLPEEQARKFARTAQSVLLSPSTLRSAQVDRLTAARIEVERAIRRDRQSTQP